jgi:hypothetical protein
VPPGLTIFIWEYRQVNMEIGYGKKVNWESQEIDIMMHGFQITI